MEGVKSVDSISARKALDIFNGCWGLGGQVEIRLKLHISSNYQPFPHSPPYDLCSSAILHGILGIPAGVWEICNSQKSYLASFMKLPESSAIFSSYICGCVFWQAQVYGCMDYNDPTRRQFVGSNNRNRQVKITAKFFVV